MTAPLNKLKCCALRCDCADAATFDLNTSLTPLFQNCSFYTRSAVSRPILQLPASTAGLE